MDVRTRVGCYAWVERDGAVLLSHWSGTRHANGLVARPGWTLVGGGIEPGETPEQAAVREVREESGYDVRLTGVLTTDAWSGIDEADPTGGKIFQAVRIIFTAEVVGGDLTVEVDGSSDDARWVPLEELPSLRSVGLVSAAWRAAGGPGLPAASISGGIVDEDQVARVVAAALAAQPRCGDVRVVAIDGPSGSGKSVIARAVAQDLGAPLIQMDDLYAGWDGLAAAPISLAEQVLEPVARGERAAYRRWDWHASGWATGPVEVAVEPGGVLVVEGCGSSVGAAGEYAAVRVWVDAETELRRRRGIVRDGEAFRPHWERWAAQEEQVFGADGTRERADLVIDTTPASYRPS